MSICMYIKKKSDKQSAIYSEEKKMTECFDGAYVKVIKHENGKK
jgi:hypothetical protein